MKNRKLLGGVSFDGGAGGGGKGAASAQAGVQNAHPSFSDVSDYGLGIGQNISANGAGGKGAASEQKNTGKAKRDTVSIQKTKPAPVEEVVHVEKEVSAMVPVPGESKSRLDVKKYIGKLQKGIRTLMKGTEQSTDKENSRRRKKKDETGTRAIRKEDVFLEAAEDDYLLDSYNKYGERSTLGKQ